MKRSLSLFCFLISFITISGQVFDTITDSRDGQKYRIVLIGDQWWMAENLKTTLYTDGTSIPLVTDNSAWTGLSSPAYCWYNNDETTYKDTYGALYNWYTVETNKLCPSGWQVPSDDDWIVLSDNLGGESVAGGKLKETGISHWSDPNIGATDEYGFTALPGGHRYYYGTYSQFGGFGLWWSTSKFDALNAWYRYLTNESSSMLKSSNNLRGGFSIRCVKDQSIDTDSLIAYYPFNGNANDESGNGNDGTIIGGPTLSTDRFGNSNSAYAFDGVDDYIEIPHSSSLNIEDQISITFWAKLESLAPFYFPYTIIGKSNCWHISQREDDIIWAVYIDNEEVLFNKWAGPIELNKYHHFAMIYDGYDGSIYVDGNLIFSEQGSGTINTNSNNLFLGKHPALPGYYFDGQLDEIRIHNRALSENEIKLLADTNLIGHFTFNGNAKDQSGNGIHGTVNGPILTDDRFGNPDAAYLFDGVDDYMSVPVTKNEHEEFTINVWAKGNGAMTCPKTSEYESFFSYSSNQNTLSYHQGWFVNPGGLTIDVSALGDLSLDFNMFTAKGYAIGSDSHIVQLFVNGEFVAEREDDHRIPSWEYMETGRNVVEQIGYYNGTIDDIQIFNRALSSGEIESLYHPNDPGVDTLIIKIEKTIPKCHGDSNGTTSVVISGGIEPHTIIWDDDDNSTTNAIGNLPGDRWYRVTVTDQQMQTVIDSIFLDQPDILEINKEFSSAVCTDGSNGFIDLTITGGTSPYSFIWTDGGETEDLESITPGTYSVIVSDQNNCLEKDTSILEAISMKTPEICLVTLSQTLKNLIVWEQDPEENIDFYLVYREDIGGYTQIASVSSDSLSIYQDQFSNPAEEQYLYKIRAVNACGDTTGFSDFHKTIHLSASLGLGNEIVLNWNQYEIEGKTNFLHGYEIYRSHSTDNLLISSNIIHTATPSKTSYTDFQPPSGTLHYQIVGIKSQPCYPSNLKSGEPIKGMQSNIYDYLFEGISDSEIKLGVKIFPNPFSDKATIYFSNPYHLPYELKIMDLTGKVLRTTYNIKDDLVELNRNNLSKGLYLIELSGPKVYRGKIIIE